MADDSNNEFADDIPDYVRTVSNGNVVEYCRELRSGAYIIISRKKWLK